MQKEPRISESILYDIWKKQDYKNPLKTASGDEIKVLDAGSHNLESGGPDFKNVRIRIGNLTYVGDLEIDNDYTDWKAHGHNIDSKYSKVILHATLFNKNNHAFVYTRDGRKVPSVCLSEFLDRAKLKSLDSGGEEPEEEFSTNIKCESSIKSVSDESKRNLLLQLGSERFEKKCKKIFERLKELQFLQELNLKEPVVSYDLSAQFHERQFRHSDFTNKEVWLQLLYELIFEALGYSKNKSQMMSLAQAANIFFLKKIETDGVILEKYEAALLNISGLIKTKKEVVDKGVLDYIERLSLHWNSIRPFYDGKLLDDSQWHFFRLRPQNFPTVRIAGGARIIYGLLYNNLIGTMVKKITEIHNLTVLINSLRSLFVIKSDGFWKSHYILNESSNGEIKYFIGASRSDEIIVNVILPYFAVYFEVFGKPHLCKKILKIYEMYTQRSDNQIITDVAHALELNDEQQKTIYAQGMIELFRSYCSKNKCLECQIGKTVFN
jgi:Protein of unknown function (DUF2851)